MKKKAILAVLSVVFLGGCGLFVSQEEKAEWQVIQTLGPHIRADGEETQFAIEHLDEGYAVILTTGVPGASEPKSEPASYWVKGNEAFAVNEAARKISPTLPASPSNITHERVMEAARRWIEK